MWAIETVNTTNIFETLIYILDFKLSPCSECCLLSAG